MGLVLPLNQFQNKIWSKIIQSKATATLHTTSRTAPNSSPQPNRSLKPGRQECHHLPLLRHPLFPAMLPRLRAAGAHLRTQVQLNSSDMETDQQNQHFFSSCPTSERQTVNHSSQVTGVCLLKPEQHLWDRPGESAHPPHRSTTPHP